MSGSPPPTLPSKSRGFPVIAGFIAVVLAAVLVAQVIKTGEVDKYLVGALVVLALAFSGYGGDRLIERWLERREPPPPAPPAPPAEQVGGGE